MGQGNIKPIPRSLRDPTLLAWVGVMRDLRDERGWSLGQLADRTGLSRHGLFLVEQHKRDPRGDTLTRVSRAFGLPTSATFAMAEERAALWPERCQRCNYCCIACGRLTCWSLERGCFCSGR